jgi:metal-dependent amidase/aminoacylase/carboxypeptidase family protein
MTEIIHRIGLIGDEYRERDGRAIATVIHARLGEVAFGTAPGEAVVMATLRASSDAVLKEMGDEAARAASEAAERSGLSYIVKWVEEFPATENNAKAVSIIERAAARLGRKTIRVKEPFSWTEDFSYYLRRTPGALFGLGAGKEHAPLHGERYDFPDSTLEGGVDMFNSIIKEADSMSEKE